MTDPVFDKEGNLTNLDELDRDEVAAAYQEKNRQLFGRLTDEETKRKQAEADKAKAEQERDEAKRNVTPPPAPAQPPVEQKPQADSEELRLVAKGFSDDEIAQARVIAKGQGVTLTDAVGTDLFKLWKSDKDEKAKKEAAKLGGAGGSGDPTPKEGIKPGLTREEHKAQWKNRMGAK